MTFDESCERLFKVEGFYTDHPQDKGGPTKFGISMFMWATYVKKAVNAGDIMALTTEQAKSFYRQMFWDPLKLDQIQNPIMRYVIFDQAVNRGPGTVVKQLQRLLNEELHLTLKEDGILGEETIKQLNAAADKLLLPLGYSCQMAYCRIVQTRPSQLAFLTGWIRRTQELINLIVRGIV